MVVWEFIFSIVIVISATIGLALGRLTARDYVYVISLAISFLAGMGYGYVRGLAGALKRRRGQG